VNAAEAPGASTEGMGAAGYYDAHSEYQRHVIQAGEEWIEAMMTALDLGAAGPALTVVDYGAGTGATSVHALKGAIAAVRKRNAELPVLAIHNDVPTSDFSQLFRNVRGPGSYLELQGGQIYPAAAAGSFFGQVLPSGTVHAGMLERGALAP
jgi:SAM dependent carboxyl methyltransferase